MRTEGKRGYREKEGFEDEFTATGPGQSLQESPQVPKTLHGRVYENMLGQAGLWRSCRDVPHVGREVATRLEGKSKHRKSTVHGMVMVFHCSTKWTLRCVTELHQQSPNKLYFTLFSWQCSFSTRSLGFGHWVRNRSASRES